MRIAEIGVLVRALDCNDQAAAEVARRAVAAAIGTRQTALRELQATLLEVLAANPHRGRSGEPRRNT